jgi:hypothetical protein
MIDERVMAAGVPQADGSLRPEPQIQVADVARTVRDMASLPLDANIATCPSWRPRWRSSAAASWPVTTSSDLLDAATARAPAVRVWSGREANRTQSQTASGGHGGR